jgi:hypothetical protein
MLGRYNGNPVTAGGVDNFIENTFDMGLVSRESWYVRRRRVGPAPSGMLAPRRDCEGSQPPPPLPVPTGPNKRLRRQCRKKLMHLNFLAALQHARHHCRYFGEDNFNIYPCLVCNGIHIGHRKANKNNIGKI